MKTTALAILLLANLIGDRGPDGTFFNGQTWVRSWREPIDGGTKNWIAGRKYAARDRVVHGGKMYQCIDFHVAGDAFEAEHWFQVYRIERQV